MSKYTIPSVFTAIDKFSGPVDKMSKNATDSFARVERRVRKVGQASMNVARKSAMVGAAVSVPLIAAGNEAVKFEQQMSNVSTLLDTNTENMEAMGNQVLDLATKLPVPLEELTTSLYDIRSAGIAADDAMGTLSVSAKLSVAGLSTASEATDVMTSSLNAFAAQGLSAQETANIIFKTVKAGKTDVSKISQSFGQAVPNIAAAGIKLQDFSAATAALTKTGMPASVAQTKLAASINKLNKPTEQMEKLFKKLGVESGQELIDTSENLVDVYSKLDKASKDHNINLAKAWGSSEALGASNALLGAQNKDYVEILKDMNSGTDAVTEAYEKQSKTAKSNMQVVKNNIQVLGVQLGQALLPVVADLAKAILPVVKSFSAWVKRNPELVKSIARFAVKAVLLSGAISGIAFTIGILAKGIRIVKGVQTAYNVVLGITQALMSKSPMSIRKNATALAAYSKTTKLATIAQKAFTVVASLGPWGMIAAGAVAAGAAIYGLVKAFDGASSAAELNAEVSARAKQNSRDQRVEVMLLFEQLRKAKTGTDNYNAALKQLEAIQPGITNAYNLQAGAVNDLNNAEKALLETLELKAKAEAASELAKEKYKKSLAIKEEGGSGSKVIDFFASGFGVGGKVAAGAAGKKEAENLQRGAKRLISIANDAKVKADKMQQQSFSTNSEPGPLTNPMMKMLSVLRSGTKDQIEVNVNLNGPGADGATATATSSGATKPTVSTTNN